MWSDENRFNQGGYSAPTIFPKRENYKDIFLFYEDLKLAEAREEDRNEWIMELKMDYYESRDEGIDDDYYE